MADKKLNVLVYSGNGSTVESVKHCVWSLRRLLSPNYAVIPISGETVLKEPWQSTCALFVMPGGADLGYCRTLNGEGNRRISMYVNRGGAYLGLCAGGYYGCARCEFEMGKPGMEVAGDRELAFFPGTCRGLAFPGFVYHSEKGTRAAEVKVNREALLAGGGAVPEVYRTYYNGGGVFVDAPLYKDKGVEVLASYTDKLAVDSGEGTAAAVYCKVGDGGAILTSSHPEFAAVNLGDGDGNSDYPTIKKALADDDKQRVDFMKACLSKLGLTANKDDTGVPSLSRLHLSAAESAEVSQIVKDFSDIVTTQDSQQLIKAEHDTFSLETPSSFGVQNLVQALPKVVQDILPESVSASSTSESSKDPSTKTIDEPEFEGIIDYDKIVKRLVAHETSLPESKETPYFNHNAFYANLKHYNSFSSNSNLVFGKTLLYGEVVTSTSTLLEKNPTLLSKLPQGLTATATTQVAGRGRGNNVWVSPPGSLMFSTLIRHALDLNTRAPVVFIQYLAALAIVSGIQNYDTGYENLPVRLKWPNDIYALDPSKSTSAPRFSQKELTETQRADYVKIGGILVNSSYSGGDYTLVVGIGINAANASPTTSLNQLAQKASLPPFTLEKLLASILTQFEILYTRFCVAGFTKEFEALYYSYWLHAGQVVTLEQEGGARAVIRGITRDWGLLVAEELGWEDRPTGKKWELQSDSNSFDFFRGLLKRKV